jgi:hypothetical protein
VSGKHLSPLFSWRGAIVLSDLPSQTRLVALVLSLHMNERGGSCFPTQRTLATESGLSPRQVRRHLKVLAEHQWLTIDNRPSKTGLRSFYTAEVPLSGYLPRPDPADVDDLWEEDTHDRTGGHP